ncbi:MAG: MSMEG_0569 family flavin-dependent oxidoreductase [Verrucomicrobiota bacterium]
MENKELDVAIIGGGQAGLSMSHCLMSRGLNNHLIFERNQLGHSWRNERWDSFCLVTPNFQCRLPGYDYDGTDPNGFMLKNEIVAFIERYAKSFNPPLMEGVTVNSVLLRKAGFTVETSSGSWNTQQVVIATGAYHRPRKLPGSQKIPGSIMQIHSAEYKNPKQIPDGEVIVVGSAQSGCQIAEDLHLEGRKVHLCLGSAPRSPRFYRGRDVVDWFEEMGHYDKPIHEFENPEEVRHETNHYLTGRDGGREMDLRQFALEGMSLYGFLESIDASGFNVRPDVNEKLDLADETYVRLRNIIDKYILNQGLEIPSEEPYIPVWKPNVEQTRLNFADQRISAIIWAIGFAPEFGFVKAPVFDNKGYPCCVRGVTDCPGLYFLGLPWLYTWGSGRFAGVARDADYLAEKIALREPIHAPI